LERVGRYKRLCAPMALHLDNRDGPLRARFEWLDGLVVPPPSLALFEAAFLVRLARIGTREAVRPERVIVPSEHPARRAAEVWLGCRIEVGILWAVVSQRSRVISGSP
jgi:hypothetical protein